MGTEQVLEFVRNFSTEKTITFDIHLKIAISDVINKHKFS